jgi:RND superfamily putative drug exporter
VTDGEHERRAGCDRLDHARSAVSPEQKGPAVGRNGRIDARRCAVEHAFPLHCVRAGFGAGVRKAQRTRAASDRHAERGGRAETRFGRQIGLGLDDERADVTACAHRRHECGERATERVLRRARLEVKGHVRSQTQPEDARAVDLAHARSGSAVDGYGERGHAVHDGVFARENDFAGCMSDRLHATGRRLAMGVPVFFDGLGALVFRRRWAVLAASAVFLAFAIAGLVRGGSLTSGVIHGLEAEKAQRAVDEVTGRPADTTLLAVLHADGLDARSAEFTSAARAALDPLHDDPHVLAVVTPDLVPPSLAEGMVDGPGGAALAYVTLRGDFAEARRAYVGVRDKLRSNRLAIDCTGRVAFMHDLDRTLEHDLLHAELVSIPLALLVLLLVFRTVTAALLPVGIGGLAVVGGIAIVAATSHVADIAQYTINVCSLIGTGVAIDYSLFIVSRYREQLASGKPVRDALVATMGTAGRMVGFSGVAVATGLAGLLFFDGSYLFAMGVGGVVVVALAVLFALTFLPALLAVLGHRVNAGKLPLPRYDARGRFWRGMATRVMRHPWLFVLPTMTLLLLMGSPFLHLRFASADVRVLPGEVEARRAYDLLRRHFPDQAANRIAITVRFPSPGTLTPSRLGALQALEHRIAALPAVRKVQSTGNILYAVSDTRPESDAARAIVRAIREDRAVADGNLLVGGETARDVDATRYIATRVPKAISLVVGATVLVVFLLLRSVLLPLKAVVMNFLSIAGSFGALVWIFQDGHLFVQEPRPVEPSLPILLFCIVFGLSMDYEVLLLSRMKESWDRTHDNTTAVADGLEQTGGLITSAATIMIAVFGAFALARVVLIKAVGVGMALAVAVDATLVRVLLVPATMRLLGHLNWWSPAFLARSIRRSASRHHRERISVGFSSD